MPFTLVVLTIVFVATMIWLVNWEPGKSDSGKKNNSSLCKEIEDVFKELKRQAITYKRDEYILPLDNAKMKIIEVLEKKGCFNKC